ncbi:MAG TPA: hypothetical protein VJV23_16455, partial [Candidatus Polarisedimenticolia bacterium]|nr:hypothetical protein [Candidatus Polarisedimenticolia bacterium]
MTGLQACGLVLLGSAWGFADGYFTPPSPAAAAVFAAAGLACLAGRASGRREGLATALLAAAAQAALSLCLPVLMAHLHDIPLAAEAAAALVSLAGIEAAAPRGLLLLDTARGTQSIALTWELAALPAMLRLLAGLAAADPGRFGRHAAVVLAAATTRLVALVALLAAGARVSLCYEPAVTALAFVAFAP